MGKKLKFWLDAARWASLPQSLMPALTAVVLCIGLPGFSPALAVLAVLGVCLAHLSCNLFDDYFDYRSHETGYRDTLARAGVRARTGKCPYLTDGSATPRQLLAACCLFGAAAAACGVVIFLFRGAVILYIAVPALVLGLEYSGPPLRLSYHGLGELVIGAVFGPLNMLGCGAAACGRLLPELGLSGVCLGLLVTNILYTHSVLDFEADQSVHKTTLAALLPGKKARLGGSAVLLFLPYLLLGGCAAAGVVSRWYLLCLLTLPWAAALYRSMADFSRDPSGAVTRRGWYGNMGDWGAVCAAGLDWFLLRWFLARNLVTFFSAAVIAAGVLEKAAILP